MKITRKHLRNIIKEEITRIAEQQAPIAAGGRSAEMNDVVNRIQNAANELAYGYSDPLDDLSDKIMSGEVTTVEEAWEMAELAVDMLARLDNAGEIGVYEASVALGL